LQGTEVAKPLSKRDQQIGYLLDRSAELRERSRDLNGDLDALLRFFKALCREAKDERDDPTQRREADDHQRWQIHRRAGAGRG